MYRAVGHGRMRCSTGISMRFKTMNAQMTGAFAAA
jgi:hypothetical protein